MKTSQIKVISGETSFGYSLPDKTLECNEIKQTNNMKVKALTRISGSVWERCLFPHLS